MEWLTGSAGTEQEIKRAADVLIAADWASA